MNRYDDSSPLPAMRGEVRELHRQGEHIERMTTEARRKIQFGDGQTTAWWRPAVATPLMLQGAVIIALLIHFVLQGLR